MGELFGHVRKKLPWADPKIVKVMIFPNRVIFVIIICMLLSLHAKFFGCISCLVIANHRYKIV